LTCVDAPLIGCSRWTNIPTWLPGSARATLGDVGKLRFGDALPWIPNRAWAQEWTRGAPDYWSQVIKDYRDRVRTHYGELLTDDPEAFPFMRPTRVRIVVSLARLWVFAAGVEGGEDEVVIDARWEDEALATFEILHAPDHEQQARRVAEVGDAYELLDATELHKFIGPDDPKSDQPENPFRMMTMVPGVQMPGWALADNHVNRRKLKVIKLGSLGWRQGLSLG
jgi:hypothetical protein